MPLDPLAAKFLEQCAASGVPPYEQTTPEHARQIIRSSIAALGPPEEVAAVENRRIPGPKGDIPIRVYRPTSAARPAPAVVFFHGGGWVIGDLDTHDGLCRALANAASCV